MVFIRKPIDIISHADGKRYTSASEYDRSIERQNLHVMTEKEYKQTKERLMDEARSKPKKREEYNHVHIDFNNGRIEKSKRKDV